MKSVRNRQRHLPATVLVFLLIPFATGCHHRPHREIRQANADIRAARRVQAEIYAPASFEEARRALVDAERMLKKRKFEEARLLALESSALAKSALSLSSENREKMTSALRLQIEAAARKISDGEKEAQEAELKPIDPKRAELFRMDLLDARARLDAARDSLREGNLVLGKKQADDADIAAESLLREVRLTVAKEPISHPQSKKRTQKIPS